MLQDWPIISAFACELLLAAGVIFFLIRKSSIPRCLKPKRPSCSKVCTEPVCKRIEGCMVRYMKKQLAHEDDDLKELEDVKKQLKIQISIHTKSKMTKEKERHSMMQCLRTSLVKYPDDIRGRRRAYVAQDILAYHVYGDPDFSFRIKSRMKRISHSVWDSFGRCFSFCLPNCLLIKNAKQKILCKLDSLIIVLTSLIHLVISFLDVYSDLTIIYVIFMTLTNITELNKFLEQEDYSIETNLPVKFRSFQNMTTNEITKVIAKTCKYSYIEQIKDDRNILQNMLSKYLTSLLSVFLIAILKQSKKSVGIAEICWTSHYEGRGRQSNSTKMAPVLFACNFIVTPFLTFWDMFRTSLRLKDPELEGACDPRNYEKSISLNRNRYHFLVTESFAESLASCRIQLSFYLAFAYIAGSQDSDSLECLGETLLGEDKGMLTFKYYGWHGMPHLAFSALMSLISITQAQFKIYKTRHEFDMTGSGKLLYLASALLAAFVKISVHVMFYTMALIVLINPKNEGSQLLVCSLPPLLIYYLQTKIVSIVNWWTASTPRSGYSLMTNTAFLWPTTTNMQMERSRLRRIRSLNREKIEQNLAKIDMDPKTIFKEQVPEPILVKALSARSPWWYIDFLCPIMATFAEKRLEFHPEQYSFDGTVDSRKMFRKRFQLALGLNFGLLCFQMLIGLVIMVFGDIDTRSQLATENATWVWLSLIPAYVLALILLLLFYEKGHTWRKENVIVGFQFTSNIPFEKNQNMLQQIIAQTNFRGSWVVTPGENDNASRNSNEINNDLEKDQESVESPSTTTMDPNSFELAQISNKPENPSEDHSDHLLDVGQSNSEGEIQVEGVSKTLLICDSIIFLLHIVSVTILAMLFLYILLDRFLGKKIFDYVIKGVMLAHDHDIF